MGKLKNMNEDEKAAHYEKVKRKNFASSSKLEGIDIKPSKETLKEIIAKYKEKV